MKKFVFILAVFFLGVFARDFSYLIVPSLNADVAGMDYYDLRRDRDFKKAVQYIVEDCDVDGDSISC